MTSLVNFTSLFNTFPIRGEVMTRGQFVESKGKYEKIVDGKPFTPALFPKDWNEKFKSTKSTVNSSLLAALVLPPYVFIDFDSKKNYEIMLEILKPEHLENCYHSVALGPDGVEITGGHIGFKVNEKDMMEYLDKRDLEDKDYEHYLGSLLGNKADNIDIQFNGRLIFLATPNNKTKRLISCPSSLEEFAYLPKALIYFINSLRPQQNVMMQQRTDYDNSTFLSLIHI